LVGCKPEAEKFGVSEGSSCVRCHGGAVDEAGARVGIELAHKAIEGVEFPCVQCHGGDPTAVLQAQAHVVAVAGEPVDLYSATNGELDAARPERIQFVNPGDLRVALETCGAEGCHPQAVKRVKLNLMATYAGEHAVLLYRAGSQEGALPREGIHEAKDPDGGGAPGVVASLVEAEDPEALKGDEGEVGPWIRHYSSKSCDNCHLWSSGPNDAPGTYRASGCTACHMVYSDEGISASADPNAAAAKGPHPLKHELTLKIPSQQCGHCHFRGARIWPSYQGFRESAGEGLDSPDVVRRAQPEFGRPGGFYIEDEDGTNDVDETPADVHFEAGMWCIDCHTQAEIHGDGRLYGELSAALEVTCETCHGTSDAITDRKTVRGRDMPNLKQDDDGIWLIRKSDGERLKVTQIKESLDEAAEGSALHQTKSNLSDDFNHSKNLQCYTCHSGWMPNCYGCHVTVDLRRSAASTLTGAVSPGAPAESRQYVATDSLVLMFDTRGRIAPSMPAEKMFVTAIDAEGADVFRDKVRPGSDEGATGHGQRPVNPHTIQRYPQNAICSTCHPLEDGSNTDAVWGVAGLGSGRFPFEDESGEVHQLDRIVTDESFESQVTVGHELTEKARPLDQSTIEGMLDVVAPF
jgi:hypothetical protein